jgi:hypothetical protein
MWDYDTQTHQPSGRYHRNGYILIYLPPSEREHSENFEQQIKL